MFRMKFRSDGSVLKHKARLVAKGFHQTPGVDFWDTFSSVIKPSTIRVIFTLAISFGWRIQQVDVNNAFLNGDLQEVVFMEQPIGFINEKFPHHVCQLKKVLYGLKQAPRAWFNKLKGALHAWGFHASTFDISLFIKRQGADVIFLLIYVDDILVTCNNHSLISTTIKNFNSRFALKDLGEVNYFLGFEAYRDASGLFLTQTKHIHDLLAMSSMLNSKPSSTPLCSSLKLSFHSGAPFADLTLCRSIIGALQYVTYTRPDISFAVNKLSQFKHLLSKGKSSFSWVDSVLIKSIEKGEWVIFENANLCNPSILDRLNSQLEEGNQTLGINEQGLVEGDKLREVKSHDEFRSIFLISKQTLVDQGRDVSRALRNRCL